MDNKEIIHICFSISDKSGKYSKFPGTAIYSVFKNTEYPVCIHILHDNTLIEKQKTLFRKICSDFGQVILFHDMTNISKQVENMVSEKIHAVFIDIFTYAVFYKLILWEVLPQEVNKVILLDGDVIINMDIHDLWMEETGNNGVAAVVDSVISILGKSDLCRKGVLNKEKYFNVGVMLLERKGAYVPLKNMVEGFSAFIDLYYVCDYPEQDFFNYIYDAECNYLDEKYNTLVSWNLYNQKHIIEKKIYHYSGTCLGLDMKNVYDSLFMQYFTETPFYNYEFIKRLMDAVSQLEHKADLYVDWKNVIKQL